jgi:hypothetical protein
MSTPITLSDGVITLDLPGDMVWHEHFGWSPVVQQVGSVYSVMMRHDDPPAVEATLLAEGKNPLVSTDWMRVTLKLMEI